MRQRIEIHDAGKNNVLEFDLKDILQALDTIPKNLEWHLLDLEASGEPLDDGESILDLEKSVRSNEQGRSVSWEKLQRIADSLSQTVNALIVGTSPGQPPPPLPVQPDYRDRFIIIEAIDSSLWTVSSNDPAVIEKVRQRFHDTR